MPLNTSRYTAVVVSVFCLSTAAAFAQEDAERMAEVLCVGDPECLALARHRLTTDNLRKMFAVDRELFALEKSAPEVEARMHDVEKSLDPQGRMGKTARAARALEATPETARILRTHQISGHQFLMTRSVAMVTAMYNESPLTDEVLRSDKGSAFMTPALKFWRAMDPALKAEAAAWTKMRGLDKGLNR